MTRAISGLLCAAGLLTGCGSGGANILSPSQFCTTIDDLSAPSTGVYLAPFSIVAQEATGDGTTRFFPFATVDIVVNGGFRPEEPPAQNSDESWDTEDLRTLAVCPGSECYLESWDAFGRSISAETDEHSTLNFSVVFGSGVGGHVTMDWGSAVCQFDVVELDS